MSKGTPNTGNALIVCTSGGRWDGLPYRVVSAPVTRSIPLFAMGVEKGRDEVEQAVLTSVRALRQAVGQKAATDLLRGRYGLHVVVQCRRRSGRTATYKTCISFAQAADAQKFEHDFPHFKKP